MTYNVTMQATFEAEKNKKAFTYTIIICAVLLILAFIITWPILTPPPPPLLTQDLLEINLGNNQDGFGVEQPLIKGQRAPAQEPEVQPQKASAAKEEPSRSIEPDDNAEEDAAPVTKIEKPTIKTDNIAEKPVTKPTKTNTPATIVAPPAPKPQKPKITYNGPGNGTGNGATEDNGYRSQGNTPGDKGDAGDPSGKPDSYGNTPGGTSSPRVIKGVKPLNLGVLKFEDDFNDNAKVTMDVVYNSAGSIINTIVAKGTTTTNKTIISIAKRKAVQLKFPVSAEGGVTTILFNFTVKN